MVWVGCGLSQREKYVADTNAQILTVRETSDQLAQAIAELPDEPSGPESFTALIAAYRAYRQEVDRLNVLIHRLAEVVPELTEHLRDAFDPDMGDALDRCTSAVTTFEQAEGTDQGYRQALTSMCLCIERYAAAVTAVSREYARLAG